MNLMPASRLAGVPRDELSFKIHCASDDYGSLIEQRAPQAVPVGTAEIQSCSSDRLTIKTPEVSAGSYKLTVHSGIEQAVGALDVTYRLGVDSVGPNRLGLGGGALITVSGSGFTDNTKATMCGEELEFFERGQLNGNSGKNEYITFVTNPIDLNLAQTRASA